MLKANLSQEARAALAAGITHSTAAFEHYVRGKAYLRRFDRPENVEQAIDLFGRAIAEDSLYALAYAALGEAYWRKYDTHTRELQWAVAAERNCERALGLEDQIASAHIMLALIHTDTGSLQAAQREIQRALELDPSAGEAYRIQGRLLERKGDMQEAEEAFRTAIDLDSDFWLSYNSLGNFYRRQSRYNDAIPMFERVIERTPDNFWGYNGLGATYYQMGRLNDARIQFKHALEIREDFKAYSNLGAIYQTQKNYVDAARAYEKALELRQDYRVWGNLAGAYKQIPSERHKADQAFERAAALARNALTVSPDNISVKINLALYYANLGREDDARVLADEVRPAIANNAYMLFFAAVVYELIGDRAHALAAVESALEAGLPAMFIEEEPDLDQLREDPAYQDLQTIPEDAPPA